MERSGVRCSTGSGRILKFLFRNARYFHKVFKQSNFQIFIAVDGYRNSSGTSSFHIHMVATANPSECPASVFK